MDEEALMMWQDVFDAISAGRPADAVCPYCRARPLTVEEVEFGTRITCPKCHKYVEGRFGP